MTAPAPSLEEMERVARAVRPCPPQGAPLPEVCAWGDALEAFEDTFTPAVVLALIERARRAEAELARLKPPPIGEPLVREIPGTIVNPPGLNWEISQDTLDQIAEIERHIRR